MTVLDLDILYEVVDHIKLFPRRERKEILSNLSSTCKELNNAVRPILFHDVRWPHRHLSKISGCEDPFFPDAVWNHIFELYLQWPEDWPDTSPQFLDYAYHQMLDKLRIALPRMTSLRIFQMTWPLTPPSALLTSLAQCNSLKDIRIIDTPLVGLFQVPDFSRIERMTLVPVAEAMRTGEGPFNNKFRELQYFARPYRQRHRQKPNVVAAHQYIFVTHLARNVRYLQISTQYLQSLVSLASPLWPELQTLVLTGLTLAMDLASIAQVVVQMPKLSEMRLLLAKRLYSDDRVITFAGPTSAFPPSHTDAFSRIKRLSLSNSYEISGLLKHTSSLERLSITAISRHPQIPIAMTTTELMRALQGLEVGGGNSTLRKLRVMTEDNLTVELFKRLGRICPKLDFVEVELCGYRDGEAGFEWTDYAEVFSTYQHLRELRIGIPFADCEEPCKKHADSMECIRCDRRDCATYFASCVPTLHLIGFEYRIRTGSHRKEDRWLDYEIVRLRDENITLLEIAQTWYPFPEVWERDLLHDS